MIKSNKPYLYVTPLIGLMLSLASCEHPQERINTTLEIAGDNKSELQIVMDHYKEPKDSLKLRATYFLITNMPGHYQYTGEQLDVYDAGVFDSISDMTPGHMIGLFDRLKKKYGPLAPTQLDKVLDVSVLTSDYLIDNIESAFKSWQKPWARHLTFDQFCEYLLPYRVTNGPIEEWREFLESRYSGVLDSLKDDTGTVEACSLVNRELMKEGFLFSAVLTRNYPVPVSLTHLLAGKKGKCDDLTGYTAYTMRSLGIPVVKDFVTKWANINSGHSWNAVLDENGKHWDFLGTEDFPGEHIKYHNLVTGRKAAKIWRTTFAPQLEEHEIALSREDIPNVFRNVFCKDVTEEYMPTTSVSIDLTDHPEHPKYAYLCTFDNQNWIPVFWARTDSGSATFENMGRNVVYLPMYYIDGQYQVAGEPFLITKDGLIRQVNPENETESVTLIRKYPVSETMKRCAAQLIGGKFQGSNDRYFRKSTDLFKLEQPYTWFAQIDISCNEKFQYIRYIPPLTDSISYIPEYSLLFDEGHFRGDFTGHPGSINMSEIEVFTPGIDTALSVQAIGYHSGGKHKFPFTIAFDGKISTTFRALPKSWIGADLGKPYKINKFRFMVRNNMNIVEIGHKYKLQFWDGKWRSVGETIAEDNFLVFHDVPKKALLRLQNLTQGKQERIFTYENGQQVWW